MVNVKFSKSLIKLNYCKKVFFFLIHLLAKDVLVMKKLEIEKIKPTFIISVLKVENQVVFNPRCTVSRDLNSSHKILPTVLDNDGKILPGNRLECLEEGIDYIRKNEESEFANINQVDSADLCREICYVVDECFHWTWKKDKSSCHLKSEILKTGFR